MKERPVESTLPSEIKEKAREYAKTIEHSYADTREELEEDVALAWAKGFTFCLQGKVEASYKDKEETIQKLTDENKKLKVDVAYYTQKLERVLSDLSKLNYLEDEKENAELKESVIKFSKEGLDFLHSIKSNRNCINCESKMSLQLTKAKEIMKIAMEGIKHWGIVAGKERPFEKQAEKLFYLFFDKAEQFLKDCKVEK